jgi:2-amino-4-hydroxy-6-hydroxymethyldihydropteridine diphosphokinase
MAKVHIGVGSNLGERVRNCERAIEMLAGCGVHPSKISSVYETEPWGVTGQPGFINMALEAATDLGPRELLDTLKQIESRLGRSETERWGPRIIDLDILLYEDLVLKEPGLVVPHPLMHEREFVLRPLAEVAPEAVHPVLGKRIKELARIL